MFVASIEFARVQTYLFAVPRMRGMLGANASLGETIRHSLVELARTCGAQVSGAHSLTGLPGAHPEDPLTSLDPLNQDDPRRLLSEYGVIAREGGHFNAVFLEKTKAEHFAQAATACIAKELPGLSARVSIRTLNEGELKPHAPRSATALLDLPVFQVCQETGDGPAATTNNKHKMVGTAAAARQEQGRRFAQGNTADIIGLLQRTGAIPQADESPEDLNDLCGKDYLALIHADGNGIGLRYTQWLDQLGNGKMDGSASSGELQREIHGECFFHSMRVAVRRALVSALRTTFSNGAAGHYQLLMLGGDDLLLACRAKSALRFVSAYANALQGIDLVDGKPLTIGVGVAIAKPAYPFHRLHQLAEELAGSAKRLYRANSEVGSVVDWHICTQSWVDDPVAQRTETAMLQYGVDDKEERLILSQGPYPILGQNPSGSLANLLDSAKALIDAKPARSQMRAMVESLGKGRLAGELAWSELPDATKTALKSAGFVGSPWFSAGNGHWRSPLPDLVDIVEIDHLGARDAVL